MTNKQRLEQQAEERRQDQANREVRALSERVGVHRVLRALSIYLLSESEVARGEGDSQSAHLLAYIGEEVEAHADDLTLPS